MAPVILFDFFGRLVSAPSRLACVHFPKAYQFLTSLGSNLTYGEFFARWEGTGERFDHSARTTHREYSMIELGSAFFTEHVPGDHPIGTVQAYIDTFLAEWDSAVHDIDGIPELIEALSRTHRLGIVSNTNDTRLVPSRLERLGITRRFSTVMLSVEHGMRKPHPAMFKNALSALGVNANEAIFVGDSYEVDYLGPRAVGIDAWLIDPDNTHDVDPRRRLTSIIDLPARLTCDA